MTSTRTPASEPRTLNPDRSLTHRYNQDWQRLVRKTDPVRHQLDWPGVPVTRYGSLDELLRATTHGGDLAQEDADALLAGVVRAAAHCDVAARLVLQRLIPVLVSVTVRRAARRRVAYRALFEDLVANAWIMIRSYPIDRRPTKIAVNLLRDTEHRTFVRPFRLQRVPEVSVPKPGLVRDTETDVHGRPLELGAHPAQSVAQLLHAGRSAGMAGEDVALIEALYLDRRPVGTVARELGVTPRTVYTRRRSAEAALARCAA